jgi:transcriptional regulator with XRE-family HTH domain
MNTKEERLKVATKIKAARLASGLSGPKVINRLYSIGIEVCTKTYYRWESAESDISITQLKALALIFEKPMDFFL